MGATLQKQVRKQKTYMKPEVVLVKLFGPNRELLIIRHPENRRKHKTTILHYSSLFRTKGWFRGVQSEIVLMRVPIGTVICIEILGFKFSHQVDADLAIWWALAGATRLEGLCHAAMTDPGNPFVVQALAENIHAAELDNRSPRDIVVYTINVANLMNSESSPVSFVEHYRTVNEISRAFKEHRKQRRLVASAEEAEHVEPLENIEDGADDVNEATQPEKKRKTAMVGYEAEFVKFVNREYPGFFRQVAAL